MRQPRHDHSLGPNGWDPGCLGSNTQRSLPFSAGARAMLRALSFAILLVPSVLSAQAVTDTTPRPIELDEAVRLATRNSPAAVQARGDLRVSRVAIKSAYLGYLPDVSVGAGRNWAEGFFQGEAGQIRP